MTYIGADYGFRSTNTDPETGIRYGVISQRSILQAWYDHAEADYGEPACPECGNGVIHEWDDELNLPRYRAGCADYACMECGHTLDSSDCLSDEPIGWLYEGEGYKLADCLDSDVIVLASPYYTFSQFCSPCVPGAGDLDNPMPGGVKTYCLGHDWFENGLAKYPVYDITTGSLVSGQRNGD